MKKKKSGAKRWTPTRLASLIENLLTPPPRPHKTFWRPLSAPTTAEPLLLLYFVFPCRFEAI